MAVAYTGADAEILRDLAQLSAGLPAVRDFVGASSLEQALAQIVQVAGDSPAGNHLVIDTPTLRGTRTAGGAQQATADVTIAYVMEPEPGDTEAEGHRRALGWVARLRRATLDALGDRCLAWGGAPPVELAASDALPLAFEWTLDLTLDVTP